jgi:hypothetical protein
MRPNKEGQFVHRLEELLWPERFPPGHPRHDPEHVCWSDPVLAAELLANGENLYEWSFDTIEQVAELVTKELEKNSWPGPRGFEKVHVQE